MLNITLDCSNVWAPSYLSLLTVVMMAVFCLVITVGNLMIIAAVVINPLKKLRSPFNYFVVNLAVADSIVGTITMPLGIYFLCQEFLKNKADYRSLEKIFHITLFASLTASLLCLITLSIDRYIAITFPMKYRSYLTWKKCWFGSSVIWILSLSLPFIYLETGYIDFLMIYINTAVVIAAFTLIITYIGVYKFLRVQTQQMKEITRTTTAETKKLEVKRTFQQKRVTRILLWILLLFLGCYIPGAIIIYTLQFCMTCSCESVHVMRDVSFYLLTVNSCMNPFVYAFQNKHYRHAIMAVWTRSRKKIYAQTSLTTSRKNTTRTRYGEQTTNN